MKDFKGTPGPWARDYDNREYEGQWQIAGPAVIHYAYLSDSSVEEEAIANANLIAAAPELLEALVKTTEYLEFVAVYEDAQDIINSARAAINKALAN